MIDFAQSLGECRGRHGAQVPAHQPLLPSGMLWSRARDWCMWAYHYWPRVHAAVLDQARHGLKSWKAAVKQAVETAHLKPIGRWIKGVNELAILETEDGLQTDPDILDVRDAWAQVYCPDNMEVMDEDAASMKRVPWTCPTVTSEMLRD